MVGAGDSPDRCTCTISGKFVVKKFYWFLLAGSLPRAAFSMVGESLLRLDLSENELSHMDDGALSGLERLLLLNLSRNDLGRFNSDAFKGAKRLHDLDRGNRVRALLELHFRRDAREKRIVRCPYSQAASRRTTNESQSWFSRVG